MFAALIALAVTPFPAGAYGMPELCLRLKEATGAVYSVDQNLADMSVFVSAKSGDPERVKQLVALALRAEWKLVDGRYRLASAPMDMDAEYAEFERKYRLACDNRPIHGSLPVRELFNLAPGQTIRYGYPSSSIVRPLPAALAKSAKSSQDGIGFVVVRRMTEGLFEFRTHLPGSESGAFDNDGQLEFAGLPPKLSDFLGKSLDKVALTPEQQKAMQSMAESPSSMGIDWSDLNKRDPIATIADKVWPQVAKVLDCDIALALPDLSLFFLGSGGHGPATVRAILDPCAMAIDWDLADGAVIGKIAVCERSTPAQVRRSVLSQYLASVGTKGVASNEVLSAYISNQRPAASNCWADVMMLVMAGVVIDQSYVGDYPFNIRLYTHLTPADWALLKSGSPFAVSQLSMNTIGAVRELLLQPRSRLERDHSDPAFWSSIDPRDLTVTATIKDEPVLIGWTGFGAEVESPASSGSNYDMRRRHLDHEPLYQPAVRRKLTFTISSTKPGESIESGFTEVTPDDKIKPCQWMQLPDELMKQFKDALESVRKSRGGAIGAPPPFGQ